MAPIGEDSMEGINMERLKDMQEIWREALDMIWEEGLEQVNINKSGRHGSYKGTPFHHWTWNLYHPDDPKILGDSMHIHHKDLNHLNDHISNLQKMTSAEHTSLHMTGHCPSKETRQKRSESQMGEKNHMYGRIGKDNPRTNTHHTIESKLLMSQNKKGKCCGKDNPFYNKHHTIESRQAMSINRTDVSGKNNPNAKAVVAEYKEYSTMKSAGEALNVSPDTINHRIKTNKPGYSYIPKNKN